MAKYIPDANLDVVLTEEATGDFLCVCGTQPTSETEAYAVYMLARVAVTPGDGNGDFTIQNGSVSGRRLTVAQQSAISVTNSGYAAHVAIIDHAGDAQLLIVTTCNSLLIAAGGTVDVPTFDHEITDVT